MAKILVVDDDRETRQDLERWLKTQQYDVESAKDGSEAIDRLAVSDFDLIVLDWTMPIMDGMEVCKYVRNKKRNTAIIFLTAKTDLSSIESGLDSGADDYLTKPFSLRQLSARIRALLRRSDRPVHQVLECGDVRLDSVQHVVVRAGVGVDLEPKEFAMLELLMRHPHELFTTDALIRRIWSSSSEVTGASVRNCVRALRQKLGPDLIENCYGQGYRLRRP